MGSVTSTAAASPAVVPLALFGIDNNGIGVAANLLVIFLIAVWLALVFWAYADSRRRMTDPVLIGSAALAALIFPFAGALVYAIVRPPETLDDAYERALDVRAAELRVRLLESAVKGGSGSDAHSASVAAELSGEPQGRRAAPSAASKQSQPPQRTQEQRTQSQRAQEQAGSQRAGQAKRPPSGGRSRPPASGTGGA